jgi:hypothetical protein
MNSRKRVKPYSTELAYLKIPDVSKPPSPDGNDDYTIIPLNTDQNRIREVDRISQISRDGVYRKNLLLLRKERNLLLAVQHEQLGNFDFAITYYDRAALLSERLELFLESQLYRMKVKELSKLKGKVEKNVKKKRRSRITSEYSKQDLASKPILPKGITIPIVDRDVAKKFNESHNEPEDKDEEFF